MFLLKIDIYLRVRWWTAQLELTLLAKLFPLATSGAPLMKTVTADTCTKQNILLQSTFHLAASHSSTINRIDRIMRRNSKHVLENVDFCLEIDADARHL